MKKQWILLSCWFLGSLHLAGQFTNARVIDEKSGLSDLQVRVIDKDQYGFIWIGTQRGLNRFDGSQVKQFVHDPQDPESILNNQVRDLVIDSQFIWVGGTYGISSIDLLDYSIHNVRFDCAGILDSFNLHYGNYPEVSYLHLKDDVLWIATRQCGLMAYHVNDGDIDRISFTAYAKEIPNIISSGALDMIMGFMEDKRADSVFWIGTAAGLIRFNSLTMQHRHYYLESEDLLYQDAVNACRRVVSHYNGKVYYTTWSEGVIVFDPQTGNFAPLPLGDINDNDLRYYVADIRQYNEDNLWLRTKRGLYLYNTALEGIVKFYPNQDNSVHYLSVDFEDETNRRFISTNKGIYLYDPLHEQILTFSYKHLNVPGWFGFARKVISDPDGSIITVLGQSVDGLYHFSHRDNRWFETPIPGYSSKPGESFNGVDLASDEQYGWYFSGYDGIFRFDPENFAVEKVQLGITLEREKYADLEWDKNGMLWIGTRHEGLLRYDPLSQQTVQFLDEIYGDDFLEETPFARDVFCDADGNIWFVTAVGHSVYDAAKDVFYNFSSTSDAGRTMDEIVNFVEGRSGKIWAVSHKGLIAAGSSHKPENGLQEQQSIFPHTVNPTYIQGLVYGEDDRMYALSEETLYRIDTTLGISPFSMDYAPFKGEYYCFDNLFETSLVVGLRNGFAILHSTGLQRNAELPVPYLTEVTVNEKPIRGNFVNDPPQLSLKHNENFISFSFSAISYTIPEKNQFRYRLRGFDPGWIDAGARRFANYTNVPSGEYVFELEVANNEGVRNPKSYTVPIAIARPWWSTWWFRIGAAFFLVTAFISVYRFRVNQIRKETRIKTEFEKKIGDIELSALRAQMNPHFIFNCLNSIENYIIKNESIKAAEYINDFARLIRLILQNSRSEYIPLTDEIEALALYLQMESLRFDDKFDYHIDVDPDLEPTEVDIPPMLIQPFVENAIWHGLIPKKAPGKLHIELSRENGALRCVIQDNGIGRAKSREINASMHKRGKKSMGMLITRNRIEVINELYQTNATVHIIDLLNSEGSALGTRVELDIPIE